MRLDEKIRKLRTDAGLSQQQLADALLVSRSAVAKWENDNGTPDVENLKALAAYFRCDLDRLLDDDLDLQPPDIHGTSYCGKCCEACTCREERSCPGCRMGPAAADFLSCAIGECCKRQHHIRCDSCGRKEECTLLQTKADMPALLDQRIQQKKQYNEMLRRKKKFLEKWTWILFWMIIPSVLTALLTTEQIGDKFHLLYMFAGILRIGLAAAEGIILLLMSTHSRDFKIAGYSALFLAGSNLFTFLISDVNVAAATIELLLLPREVLSIVYIYYFHRGFAGVLEDVDWELSGKWKNIWKELLIAYGVLLVSPVLGAIHFLAPLMALLVLVSSVCIIVLSILRVVYLFKTARAFRTIYF